MRLSNSRLRGTAVAALLSLPLASGGAWAQQSDGADETQPTQDTTQQSSSSDPAATDTGQTAGGDQQDTLIATVGDTEIRGSDVMTIIGTLPPDLQSQPPQMLVSMALEQLILRELILEEARGQNLAADPEVVALVESSSDAAEEDAMVQVWLNRELANVVTDEAVQQVYDEAQAQGQQELPPLDQARPQIEQFLLQQAMQDLQARLRQGADVVLYDPSGQPVEEPQDAGTQQGQASPGTGTDQSAESATGSDTSGGETQNN